VAGAPELLEARGQLEGAVGCEVAGRAAQGVRRSLQRRAVAPRDGFTHLIAEPRGVGDEKVSELPAVDAASVPPGGLRPRNRLETRLRTWLEMRSSRTRFRRETFDQLDQLLGPDRLGEIAVHPHREAALTVSLEGMSRQGDDRNVSARRPFPGANLGGRLE